MDKASIRLTHGVTMGEIERALGTKNFGFEYEDGDKIKAVKVAGQTFTADEVLQKIDADRAKVSAE